MPPSNITTFLDALLLPEGFRRKEQVYIREEAGVQHSIGIRKSRSGGNAVYFSVSPGPNETLGPYQLSPVAPLKNTYWWPTQLAAADRSTLEQQIKSIALPFFSARPGAFFESRAESHVHSQLARLVEADPPFARVGDAYWRMRGEVIDVVDVEFLAENRFVFIYVSVWHTGLSPGEPFLGPDDVTRVASRTVGSRAVDTEPNATIFFLGPSYPGTTRIEDAAVADVAIKFFEGVQWVRDVFEQIRPEYRHHFEERAKSLLAE